MILLKSQVSEGVAAGGIPFRLSLVVLVLASRPRQSGCDTCEDNGQQFSEWGFGICQNTATHLWDTENSSLRTQGVVEGFAAEGGLSMARSGRSYPAARSDQARLLL